MRFTLLLLVLLTPALCLAAEEMPKASRVVDGEKLPFDPKGVLKGVGAAIALLESCHSDDWPDRKPPNLEGMKKAQEGDHVRVVFARSVNVRVLNKQVLFNELVVNNAGIWLRSDNTVYYYTKYEFQKWQAFEAWHRQPAPAR